MELHKRTHSSHYDESVLFVTTKYDKNIIATMCIAQMEMEIKLKGSIKIPNITSVNISLAQSFSTCISVTNEKTDRIVIDIS